MLEDLLSVIYLGQVDDLFILNKIYELIGCYSLINT